MRSTESLKSTQLFCRRPFSGATVKVFLLLSYQAQLAAAVARRKLTYDFGRSFCTSRPGCLIGVTECVMVVPLLNIPIISVVLLLLAGILIGHLIWYRDRSDDEAMLVDLRGQNSELETALHEHKQAYMTLEAEVEDQRKGWEQLQAANLELEHARQASQYDLTEINNELARLQQLKDQAFHDLDQERQHRRAIQESLTAAEEQKFHANSLAEQLRAELAACEQQRDLLQQQAEARPDSTEFEGIRSDLEDVARQRDALQREKDALLRRLETSQEDADTIHRLREQNNDMTASLSRVHTELHHREDDLKSLREERDDALRQIEEERRNREQLEGRVGHVEHLVRQRDQALEQLAQTRSELDQAHIHVQQLREELDDRAQEVHVLQNSHEEAKLELKQETDVLRQKLSDLTREHEAVSQVLIDERTRLSGMESENHRLTAMAAEAETIAAAHTRQLQADLARKQVDLDTVRTELEEMAAQLSRERHQREHLQNVVHAQKASVLEFEMHRKDWEAQLQELQQDRDSLRENAELASALQTDLMTKDGQISNLTAEVNGLRGKLDDACIGNEMLQRRIDELNQQTSQLTSHVANLRRSHEEQIEESDQLQQTYRTAIASRMDLEAANEELEEHVQRLQVELDEIRDIKPLNVELKSRLERVVAQRDEAMHAHADHKARMEELRQELDEAKSSQARMQQVSEQLATRQADYDELRRSFLQLQTETNETNDRLRRVTVERDSQRDALRIADTRFVQLESRAKANEDTIRNLRRERAAGLANSRQPSTFSFSSRSLEELDSGGRMRRDEVLGMVYTQPPKRKDDLKRISGIAQVLEKKLNAFGVYTYRQIMEWDAVAVAEFSKLLSFRDRIERDDWIGQARGLHYETYGRAA